MLDMKMFNPENTFGELQKTTNDFLKIWSDVQAKNFNLGIEAVNNFTKAAEDSQKFYTNMALKAANLESK